MIIVSLRSIVINAEQNINKDTIDLRMNITIILQDVEENRSNVLVKTSDLGNLLTIFQLAVEYPTIIIT